MAAVAQALDRCPEAEVERAILARERLALRDERWRHRQVVRAVEALRRAEQRGDEPGQRAAALRLVALGVEVGG